MSLGEPRDDGRQSVRPSPVAEARNLCRALEIDESSFGSEHPEGATDLLTTVREPRPIPTDLLTTVREPRPISADPPATVRKPRPISADPPATVRKPRPISADPPATVRKPRPISADRPEPFPTLCEKLSDPPKRLRRPSGAFPELKSIRRILFKNRPTPTFSDLQQEPPEPELARLQSV